MARIIAGVASSHVPAIGAAIDNHRTGEPYWQRVFEGFERSKEWMRNAKPDVVDGLLRQGWFRSARTQALLYQHARNLTRRGELTKVKK